MPSRVFLLSPANSGGERTRLLFSERAAFELAQQVRTAAGAPLGDVYSFVSGLYFRGKLAYATAFAAPPRDSADDGVLVITPGAGLRPPAMPVTLEALRVFAGVEIALANARFREPLAAAARELRARVGPRCEVVLLGSIASPKYVEPLLEVFGSRLVFPADFVGRGDMSRGGLLLRCVRAGQELAYVPLVGAVRHGVRPPRLEPLRAASRRR